MADPGRPRLVATDLVGTLVRSDGTVSDRTRRAVLAIQRLGVVFVMVTARPPRWLLDLAGLVGPHGVAIVANGALLYDVAGRRVLRTHLIAPEVGLPVARLIRAALPEVLFAIERPDRHGKEPDYPQRWPLPADALVAELDELLAEPTAKLLVRHPTLPSDELLARIVSLVGDRVTATHSGSGGLVEIAAAGVSKAAMLDEFATGQGITPAESIAFGDSVNDLPMLAWAGTSYGVANAHPAVLAAVHRRCAANDDDGVAHVLEAFTELR